MAYVGISQRLLDDVLQKTHAMQQAEVKLVPPKPVSLPTGQALEKFIWGDNYELKSKIPKTWMKRISGQLTIYTPVGYITAPLGQSVLVPPDFSVSYSEHGSMNTKAPVRGEHPWLDEAMDDKSRLDEIANRWEKQRGQIREFLDACKSLNEALKLWPQLEMYIPAQYMARINAKVEKKAGANTDAVEALKNIDTEALTAAAVLSRITTN